MSQRKFKKGERVWYRGETGPRVAFGTVGTVRVDSTSHKIYVVDFGPRSSHYAAWPHELGRVVEVRA